MPTIFLYDGFRFFFYSNEGEPREPMHVHVMKGGHEAKFWLGREVALARSRGFDAHYRAAGAGSDGAAGADREGVA